MGTHWPGGSPTTAGHHRSSGPTSPDVYAADHPGRLSPVVRGFPARVYVPNSDSGTVDVIDPATGHLGRPVPVADPYNRYFTPNGRRAIVVAERLGRLDFREPRSMRLRHALPVPCPGVDHLDFSADGRYLLASCEFGASLIRVDVAAEQVTGRPALRPGAKLAPTAGCSTWPTWRPAGSGWSTAPGSG
jgi:YVTN family beta-propeller protein